MARRAFSVAAPLLWNSLPQHIKDAGSLDFLKDSWKLFFLGAPFQIDYVTVVFLCQVLNYFILSFCSFLFLNFKF